MSIRGWVASVVALALSSAHAEEPGIVLVRSPPGLAKKVAYRITAELRVPPTWNGHSILVVVRPLDPGALDAAWKGVFEDDAPDDSKRWPETQTLVGTRKFEVRIDDGRGRVVSVLAPGLQPLIIAFEPQDASVVLYVARSTSAD
jgi:hypothetical protein